jgi:tetratricopeptide (TPR) repeat protein
MSEPGTGPSAPPNTYAAGNSPTCSAALAAHTAADLAVAAKLYHETLKREPHNAEALHNLGVIALQEGKAREAIRWLKKAIRRNPAYTDAYSNLGLALKGAGRLQDAAAAYRQAIAIDPDIAEIHANLGMVLKDLGLSDQSRAAFEAALGLAPDHPAILTNLGASLVNAGQAKEAVTHLRAAVEAAPRDVNARYNLAKAHFSLGDVKEAAHQFECVVAIRPDFAEAHHNLGHALLASGELDAGWREYDWRWTAKTFRDGQRRFNRPKWSGESLAGKNIFVWSEQGLGDKILFAGLLAELAHLADLCVLETEARLVPLLSRSFPNIEVRERKETQSGDMDLSGFDFHVPLGDLPRWFRSSKDKFKPLGRYLRPDPGCTADCRRIYSSLGTGPVVGVSWASKPPKGVALHDLLPTLGLPNLTLVNLQYGDHEDEVRRFEIDTGLIVHTDPAIDPLKDVDGFTAQVAAMDAVVTIQNTTLYTAGALGVPTFALLPPAPDWRWLGNESVSPWHDSVRLYPRHLADNAGDQIKRIATDLKDCLG